MKIVHIIHGLKNAGAELMLERLLLTSIRFSEDEFVVISLTSLDSIGQRLLANKIPVHHLDLDFSPRIFIGLYKLFSLIRQEKPDIVQTWMYHADFAGGLIARFASRAKVIWGVRTTDLISGSSLLTKFIRWVCGLLSHVVPSAIICVAHKAKESHILSGYKTSLFHVIPNGFDTTALVPSDKQRHSIRYRLGFSQGHFVIGCIGRFHAAKDHENFVLAAARVAALHADARFLMAGRDVDGSNSLLTHWISATGYSDRFLLLGERDDVAQCLNALDAFCLSSRNEGFPNVVGEAMAMRLPCVVTDVGGASFLVGNTGLVVPKRDPKALSTALIDLIEMDQLEREGMGARARARIESEFSLNKTYEQFQTVYRHVLGNSYEKAR